MTKLDLIDRIYQETNLSKVKAGEAVDAILAIIKENLSSGQAVTLRRFGSFYVRHRRERMGRNPRTGERALIPAGKVVIFRSGRRFKSTISAGPRANSS